MSKLQFFLSVFVMALCPLLRAQGTLEQTQYKATLVNTSSVTQEVFLTYRTTFETNDGYHGPFYVPPRSTLVTPVQTIAPLDPEDSPGNEASYWQVRLMYIEQTASLSGNSWIAGGSPELRYSNIDIIVAGSGSVEILPPKTLPLIRPANPEGSKTVWNVADTTLTADVYREGVDKVVGFLGDTLAATASTGGAGASGDSAAESKREEKARLELAFMEDSPVKLTEAGSISIPDMTLVDGTSSAAIEAKAQVLAAVTNARATRNMGNLTDSSATGDPFTVTMGGVSINLNPLSTPEAGTLGAFIKGVIAWFTVACFEWWLWCYFKELYLTAAGLQQAKGNPVVGGTGAQGTALIAAIAIVAILVSFPAAFWALADSGFTTNMLDSDPLVAANAPAYAVTLFKFFIPVGTISSVLFQLFVVNKAGIALVGVTSAAVRFVIP